MRGGGGPVDRSYFVTLFMYLQNQHSFNHQDQMIIISSHNTQLIPEYQAPKSSFRWLITTPSQIVPRPVKSYRAHSNQTAPNLCPFIRGWEPRLPGSSTGTRRQMMRHLRLAFGTQRSHLQITVTWDDVFAHGTILGEFQISRFVIVLDDIRASRETWFLGEEFDQTTFEFTYSAVLHGYMIGGDGWLMVVLVYE